LRGNTKFWLEPLKRTNASLHPPTMSLTTEMVLYHKT
jgi:hypothetical protein